MDDPAWTGISDDAKDFIKCALNRKQDERLTAQ